MSEPHSTDRPLFGPQGRIPVAKAVALPRPSGLAAYRDGWAVPHTLTVLATAPLLFLAYRGAVQPTGVGWHLLIGTAALLGSVLLATYLPLRGRPREPVTPCLAMPAAMVLAAGVLLTSPVTAFTATTALVALGFGLARRVVGPTTC